VVITFNIIESPQLSMMRRWRANQTFSHQPLTRFAVVAKIDNPRLDSSTLSCSKVARYGEFGTVRTLQNPDKVVRKVAGIDIRYHSAADSGGWGITPPP
jgi:hypothetical protein